MISRVGRRAILRAVPPTTAPALQLRLAQQAQWRAGDGTAGPLGTPDALLLAWLALEGPTPRERLATLLWPGSSPEAARNALRQRLYRLRQGGIEVVTGHGTLALADGVGHDLHDGGALLGTLQVPECPELDAWLQARRARHGAAARHDAETRIARLEAVGDVAAALPLALALLDQEPLSEAAHRRVMRLHYLRGDRAAAMLAFDRCEQMLKHDVGARPSAETLALLASIDGTLVAAEPAPAWRGALPASVLRPPRLIGRDAELAALHRSWQAGSVALVVGEAGMGKSRLLQALGTARGPGAGSVLVASGRPGDALVPYGSFARLLRELASHVPEAFDDASRQQLAALLPGMAAAPSNLPRRASLVEPVRQLLQRARPGIDGLVFDDLHFADDASIDLLQALLAAPRDASPLRWCLGLRPPAPGSRLQALLEALATAAPLVQVPMRPLDVAQMAELVDSLALHGVRGADIAPTLLQRSGGNPLFALETLKLAWADGTLAQGTDLPRPQSLAQLIAQQLARLSPAATMLVRVAAVAGADFSLPLAERVLGQTALQLADAWQELETQQVMIGTDFAHDLVYEAVLAGLPSVIARHLHGEIAARLEGTGAEPAHVAAHWEAAGQRGRALPHLRAAAERAHLALRERERIDFLLRAADIAESTGDRAVAFDCVARAVETHMNSIRQAGGFPLLDRLDALADTPAQTATALGQRAWYCSQLADDAGAVRYGTQALALAESTGTLSLVCQIRQRLATSLAMLGRFDDALPHLQAMLPWAQQHLPDEDLAEFHGNFAVVLDNLGLPEAAREHHERVLGTALASHDHAQRATALANHAVSRLNAGDVRQARQLVDQAQQLVAAYNLDGSSAGFVMVLQMQCARAQGHYAEALECAGHAERILHASNPARVPVVALHRAHCWLDLGQHARAQHDLQAAGGEQHLPRHFEARRLLLLARVQLALGLGATATLQQAAAAVPPNGWPELRLLVDVQATPALPYAEACARLQRVREQALSLGLRGAALAALLQETACHAAASATEAGAAAAAGTAARAALALAERVEPALHSRAELWLHCARGLLAAGDDAAPAVAAGQLWLRSTAAAQVPAPFRESFLQRNPAHRALLALGA